MSWQALADAAPELAAFGAERLHDQVSYLATLKPDGSPRLHPVRPVVTVGCLYVFVEATSPKVRDLERDPRYALHATATSDQPWDLREFGVEGTARRVDDPDGRPTANSGSAFPRDERGDLTTEVRLFVGPRDSDLTFEPGAECPGRSLQV